MGKSIEDWAVKATDLSMRYGSGLFRKKTDITPALSNVSFSIRKGENYGVIGKNGCGKTSLLKILSGIISPDDGVLVFNGIHSRALLSLGLGFNFDLSGKDNALLSLMLQGIRQKDAIQLLDSIREYSELGEHFERPIRTYSAGMRSRLGFSVGITADTDLLLIDETLSVGDEQFRKKAHKTMVEKLSGSQTVVFVSHSVQQVNAICENGIWLEKGEVMSSGNMQEVSKAYTSFISGKD